MRPGLTADPTFVVVLSFVEVVGLALLGLAVAIRRRHLRRSGQPEPARYFVIRRIVLVVAGAGALAMGPIAVLDIPVDWLGYIGLGALVIPIALVVAVPGVLREP